MTNDRNAMTTDLLLGKLPEDRRVEMERQFFGDAELFDELLIAETELTDAYVTGKLAADDRELFEQRLLLSPVQRQRTVFASALLQYAAREAPAAVPTQSSLVSQFMGSLSTLFSAWSPAIALGAAAIVVLLGSVFILIDRSRGVADVDVARVQPPAAESPASNEQPSISEPPVQTPGEPSYSSSAPEKSVTSKPEMRPSGPMTIVSTILLSAGATRGAGGSKVYTIPAKTTDVRLRLELQDTGFSTYVAVVESVEGRQIASRKASSSGSIVTIQIPAAALKKGDYIVTLKGARPTGTYEPVADYTFTIDR